ncbi:MAG: V-type ATP synthase subunit E [Treponema sp.]|nr:V-type ATP synthase subunit E [Treponema sp.]
MDVQLQELIDKIKKDGVASAEEQAAKIIAEAEAKAASIVKDAKSQAESIEKEAKAASERFQKAGEDAVKQASRNLLISFRDGINAELRAIVQDETAKTYSKDLLAKLVPETVKAWADKSDSADLAVLLSKADLDALESGLKGALKDQIAKGMEIKADASLASGFRIGLKDGSAYYDYSAESVADLFAAYLNPKIAALVAAAAKEA